MENQKPDMVWVVVLVESGIPVCAEVYRDVESAWARGKSWRENMRPDYDEVGVFEVEIGTQDSYQIELTTD